jgi:hypothetical protein
LQATQNVDALVGLAVTQGFTQVLCMAAAHVAVPKRCYIRYSILK